MQNGKVLTGNTGSAGLAFTFTAPEPAGDHKIIASCTDGKNCKQEGPDIVWVGVKDGNKDLTPLPASSLWVPVGDKPAHPDNHYLTAKALNALTRLAQLYHDTFSNNPALRLNDASLKRGGVFDIYYDYVDQFGTRHERDQEGWWKQPHKEHRRGVVIDIRANTAEGAIPPDNRPGFEDLLTRRRMSYLHESQGTDNEHYHVRLLGLSL